jgi:hypothetical protein
VTTPGEVARQIMQQVYTKAAFHPRLDHSAPERPQTLTVESTKPFQRRPNPLGLAWRQHPTNWSASRARPSRTQPPSMRATSTAIFDYDYEAYGEVKRSLRPEQDSSTNEVTHAYSHLEVQGSLPYKVDQKNGEQANGFFRAIRYHAGSQSRHVPTASR